MSRPLSRIEAEYDAVVVGSGYGGGISAARLAQAGKRVCLLERGKELHPGEYPTNPVNGMQHLQARTPYGHVGARNALFDFRFHRDMSVLVGSGLGGTSLINAGVSEEARPSIFNDDRWPIELQNKHVLGPFYGRAARMLQPKPVPAAIELAKLAALTDAAAVFDAEARRAPVNVTFCDDPSHDEDCVHVNAAGVEQHACTLCGDCVSGCNVGAKNTVLMNYLPAAFTAKMPAHIFTEVEVRTVTPARDGKWVVRFRPVGAGTEHFGDVTQFVRADVVVLAAGTLGSTEILLRSCEHGLSCSDLLGEHFSGNGDVMGFAYDTDMEVHGIGLPPRSNGHPEPGPCIAGIIDLRDDHPNGGLVIEDAVVPSVFRSLMPLGYALAGATIGDDDRSVVARVRRRLGELASVARGPFAGPTDHTLMFLVMSGDDGDGRIVLEGDHAEVQWPGVGEGRPFRTDNRALRAAAVNSELHGTYIPDPIWTGWLGRSVITVHPLGGCVMGNDATDGVVDHRGRVFAGPNGRKKHKGLFVSDGSVIPRPLAVNPSLTISALAERSCELLIREWGT
jgi:cholesterol oxidase